MTTPLMRALTSIFINASKFVPAFHRVRRLSVMISNA